MSLTVQNAVTENVFPSNVSAKSPEVSIVGLDARLLHFLETCGLIHGDLFQKALIVTCAVDGIEHKTGKHPRGLAVDIRVSDLTPLQAERLLGVVCELCDHYGLTVFDERNLPGAPHFHVEVAG